VFGEGQSLDFFWQAYLRKYPAQEAKMIEARQLMLDTYNFFNQEAAAIALPKDDFREKLKETIIQKTAKQTPKKAKVLMIYKLAAACVLLVAMFSIYYWQQQSRIDYITGNGEWEIITLPDGSQVELNANSQLSLIKEWEAGADRKVWLKGEAFFKVEKKLATNAKFTVITKDLKVNVLGTAFNVNTRNKQTEVFLEEGKITLDLNGQKEKIVPGEFIAYSQENKQIINRYKKTKEIHSNWKNGILKFDDATMKEIFDEVEVIYGVDIIISDTLREKKGALAVAIPVNDLKMSRAILERVLNVKIEKKGKQFFIK
jgi:ferric-dicitrate binding protein FerR (iron transport regulator)